MLSSTWDKNGVIPQTISNCYARARFKLTDQVSQSINDEGTVHDILLARLIGINVTMDADDNMWTCNDLTDDSIIGHHLIERISYWCDITIFKMSST